MEEANKSAPRQKRYCGEQRAKDYNEGESERERERTATGASLTLYISRRLIARLVASEWPRLTPLRFDVQVVVLCSAALKN